MEMRRFASRVAVVIAAIVLIAGCASAPEPAGPPQEVRLIVFPGGFNWPIWAAQEKGYFAKHGVDLKITPTPNSVFQLTGLIEGKFDIAMTAIDNLIAYREGQGEAKIDGPDLISVMGGDNGFLRLVSVPEVKTIGELRGKTVSVDARTTGYAFVLFELLDRGGLKEPAFQVERAGGVVQRFQALMEKKQAATLLISPFEVQAQARGFNLLADASKSLGNYQGLVAGVRESWAKQNRRAVVGYIRAYVEGLDWLYNPANREEALAILMKNVPNMSRQAAEASYKVLLDPKDGFDRKARIDMEGVRTVLQLRSKWSESKKPLTDPAKYYDGAYYDQAMRGR
jgi:ABC-type nitrate/sulfonate/bicarbonate transport system substrate-binding protein